MRITSRMVAERRFRRGLALLGPIYLLLATAGGVAVGFLRGPTAGWLWAAKTGAVLAYQLGFLILIRRQALAGRDLEHLWGAANRLTLLRGALLALLAGFLFAPRPAEWSGSAWARWATWLPALIYALAAAADFADGYWAKHTGTQTRLGALLDGELDGLGILLAAGLAVQYQSLPPIFLVIGLAKPLYALGLFTRRLRGRPIHELPASRLRRRLAGFQMGLLAVFLWPVARPPATILAECLIGLPFLLGFVRDGLAASGHLDPLHPGYQRLKAFLARLTSAWLPPVLRLVLGLTASLHLATGLASAVRASGGAPLAAFFLPGGPLLPDWLAPVLNGPNTLTHLLSAAVTLIQALTILALLAGRAVSPAALLFLLLAGMRVFATGFGLQMGLQIGVTLLLYLFGPGPWRLGSAAFPGTPGGRPGRTNVATARLLMASAEPPPPQS
jgi:CDP-diacylglycerol--glycerol-3-phosphate 3-phosphatidyltransferase